MTILEAGLTLTLAGMLLVFILYVRRVGRLEKTHEEELASLDSKKRSQSTVYGKITEQFAPFMERYPFNSQEFRFIGTPVDGIQFEDDKVVFIEIKAGQGAGLNPKQQRIKRLIQERRVEWFEFVIR